MLSVPTIFASWIVGMVNGYVLLMIVPNITGLLSLYTPGNTFCVKGFWGILLSLEMMVFGFVGVFYSYVYHETIGYILCSFFVVGAILWAVASSLMFVLHNERERECNHERALDVELTEQK